MIDYTKKSKTDYTQPVQRDASDFLCSWLKITNMHSNSSIIKIPLRRELEGQW